MESVHVVLAACVHVLSRKRQAYEAQIECRKRLRVRRRRAFAKRQSRERLMFAMLLCVAALNLQSPIRSVWMKQRSSYWWEHVVNTTFTPNDWMENFRMSHETFIYLCDELRASVEKNDTIMRWAIPVERVALTLWFLSTGADYRTIGHLFGVSKSTVCIVTKEVCTALVDVLLPKYVRFLSGESLREVVDGFKLKYDFPQCAGAVDGTHIPIISPEEYPADYFNRKGWHSIVMQGTMNHLGQFVDIYVGWPGRVHDARVFANSTLYKKGQDGVLLPNWTETISGKDVSLVILGDPAYPLLPWLMKTYPDNGRLNQQQKTFNYRLSHARVVVEHAYGRLKGRWRCLQKRLDISVCDVPKFVVACVVLHNVCEVHGEAFDEDWMESIESGSDVSESDFGSSQSESGENIRQALTSFFNITSYNTS